MPRSHGPGSRPGEREGPALSKSKRKALNRAEPKASPVKPKGPLPKAFKPLGGKAGYGVNAVTEPTHRRTQRAADKLPSEATVKQYPTLKHYTAKQREIIKRDQGAALTKLARDRGYVKQAVQGYREGSKELPAYYLEQNLNAADRAQLHKFAGIVKTDDVRKQAKAFRELTGAHRVDGGERAQATAFKHYLTATTIDAHDPEAPKHASFLGKTKVAGLPIPGLHQGGFVAGRLLENLQRPANALAGAAYAESLGQDPIEGAVHSFLRRDGETRTWSDVLRRKGLGPTSSAIGGLAADIATDPLNLVTAGAAPVAEKLATSSRHLLATADELEAAGHAGKATALRQQADAVAQRAVDAPTTKGVQLGVRLPGGKTFKTSGTATAHLNRATGGSALATSVRESRPAQALGKALAPDFRPAGVTPAEFKHFRDTQRVARAKTIQGGKTAVRRGQAYAHMIEQAAKADGIGGGEEGRAAVMHALAADGNAAIINGLERAPRELHGEIANLDLPAEFSVDELPPNLKRVAQQLRKDLDAAARQEQAVGALGSTRTNYFPHQLSKAARKQLGRDARAGRRSPYDKARTDERSIREINAETPGKFTDNVPAVAAERLAKSSELVHRHEYEAEMVKTSRPFTSIEAMRPLDDVYIAGPHSLRAAAPDAGEVSERRVTKALADLKPDERLVTMAKHIGDSVLRGPVGRATVQLDGFDRYMAKLKTVLTTLNLPSYQLRNLAGDLFLAYEADTSPRAVIDAARLLRAQGKAHGAERKYLDAAGPAGTVDIGHGLTVPAEQVLREMRDHGVIDSGFYGHDMDEATRLSGNRTRGIRRGPIERIRQASAGLEDLPRAATYLSARRQGLSPVDAAVHSLRHHFDYGDLTSAERNVMRRVLPFYTFTARNTRLQAGKLVQRPGKAANYGLAMEEGRKQAGLPDDYADHLPGYYQRGLPIPVNIHGERKLLFPQLPITDLNRLAALSDPTEELRQLLQGINPVVKWSAETLMNYSLFFRDPLWQDDAHPHATHYTPAPLPISHLPMFVRVALAGGDEKAAAKGLWTAKADYLGRLLPQQNAATQITTAKVGSRNQDQLDAAISWLSGVKLNDYDPDKFNLDALYGKRDGYDGKLEDMRRLGLDRKPAYRHTLDAKAKIQHAIDALNVKTGKEKPKRTYLKNTGGAGRFESGGDTGAGRFADPAGSGAGRYGG